MSFAWVQEETRAALRGLREEKEAWLEARRKRRRTRRWSTGHKHGPRAGGAPGPADEEEDRRKALSAVDGIIAGCSPPVFPSAEGKKAASPTMTITTDSPRAERADSSTNGLLRGGGGGGGRGEGMAGEIRRKVEGMSIHHHRHHPGRRAEPGGVAPAAAVVELRQEDDEEEGEL